MECRLSVRGDRFLDVRGLFGSDWGQGDMCAIGAVGEGSLGDISLRFLTVREDKEGKDVGRTLGTYPG